MYIPILLLSLTGQKVVGSKPVVGGVERGARSFELSRSLFREWDFGARAEFQVARKGQEGEKVVPGMEWMVPGGRE